MKENYHDKKKLQGAGFVLACAALLVAGGCATAINGSSSTATMKIAESERAIDAARHDCTENEQELKNAERKLQQASAAFTAQDYLRATWLAEEAIADAQYARTMAALELAERSADELQKSNAKLKMGLNETGIH